MISTQKIEDIVNEHIDPSSEYIVEVTVSVGNSILVLIDSDEGISIDRCVKVSRAVEQSLDRDEEDFELEVSSAGLSSPLKVVRQYKKNIGRHLDVVTSSGQKYTGMLVEVSDNNFAIEVDEMVKPEGKKRKELVVKKMAVAYSEIKSATIVISFR